MRAVLVDADADPVRQRPHLPTVQIRENRKQRIVPHIVILAQLLQSDLHSVVLLGRIGGGEEAAEEGASSGEDAAVDADLPGGEGGRGRGDEDAGVGAEVEVGGEEGVEVVGEAAEGGDVGRGGFVGG